LGYSYLPPMDWKIAPNGTSDELGPSAKMFYRPGVQGGLKFGRYFDCLPWFGVEGETNLSRNIIPGPGKISPSLPGLPSRVLSGKDYFLVWAMQVSLLARYGFLKDKEVTFGRLQPYIGIGPGWEVVYGTFDSTKNFAIEALGGVRYMFNEKVSIFLEYKYSYQYKIEYQDVHFNGDTPDRTFIFNFPHHRFVLGVSYHFKNLWGN
jgi:opacity protein-like surface antigen